MLFIMLGSVIWFIRGGGVHRIILFFLFFSEWKISDEEDLTFISGNLCFEMGSYWVETKTKRLCSDYDARQTKEEWRESL